MDKYKTLFNINYWTLIIEIYRYLKSYNLLIKHQS
jgi:hypothetical protein